VAWILNVIFLYFPILGAPKSTFMGWVRDNDGRLTALAAGIICGLGKPFLSEQPKHTHQVAYAWPLSVDRQVYLAFLQLGKETQLKRRRIFHHRP